MNKYPAPWNLKGSGFIFLYRLNKEYIENCTFIPKYLKNLYCGGLACVMLVNYESSNCGPYGELLFIPGKFKCNKGKKNSITKIYVSSKDSVDNGRANWGIPKEYAKFNFDKIENEKVSIAIHTENEKILDGKIKCFGPKFPVSTKLLPFPLAQYLDEESFFTSFFGKGSGRLCKFEDLEINNKLFPDLGLKPLLSIAIDNFKIVFPKAEKENRNCFDV